MAELNQKRHRTEYLEGLYRIVYAAVQVDGVVNDSALSKDHNWAVLPRVGGALAQMRDGDVLPIDVKSAEKKARLYSAAADLKEALEKLLCYCDLYDLLACVPEDRHDDAREVHEALKAAKRALDKCKSMRAKKGGA